MSTRGHLRIAETFLDGVVQSERESTPGIRSCGSSASHLLLSKRRADHDRVSKEELETELKLSRVANDQQQSEAARLIGVTEGALRHWRNKDMPKVLPPRWALEELRRKRQEASQNRRAAG